MKPEIIVMLTHNDQTVNNAIDIFEDCKELPVKNWGFKDVGLDKSSMHKLIDNMKEAGKTTFLEIVTYTEDECMAGARLAVDFGFHYLMGTLYYDSVHEYIKTKEMKYFPFCGDVEGSPSVLKGTNEEIITDAKEMIKKGVEGFDLLAYRHVIDGQKLAEDFCSAIDVPVIIAGSINSYEKIEIVSKIDPWAFTMGSALIEKKFNSSGTFKENLELVLSFMDGI